MRQIILIALLGLLVLVGAGVLLLGEFPPHLASTPVQHTLPNDRFQSH